MKVFGIFKLCTKRTHNMSKYWSTYRYNSVNSPPNAKFLELMVLENDGSQPKIILSILKSTMDYVVSNSL